MSTPKVTLSILHLNGKVTGIRLCSDHHEMMSKRFCREFPSLIDRGQASIVVDQEQKKIKFFAFQYDPVVFDIHDLDLSSVYSMLHGGTIRIIRGSFGSPGFDIVPEKYNQRKAS